MKKRQFKKKYKEGFTLLETLIAIFILTLALTGPIYISTLAIRSAVESRDSISAYYLAQEAIELVRNTRDEDSFAGKYGGDGFSKFTACNPYVGQQNPDVSCQITYNSDGSYNVSACFRDSCPPLKFNSDGINGVMYGVEEGTLGTIDSKFTREIYIADKGAGNGPAEVTSIIKWKDKGRNKQFQLSEKIYNQKYGQYYNQ